MSENDYNTYFRKMYGAHETIASIGERIGKLYESALKVGPVNDGMPKSTNPERFANTMCEIVDLRTLAENLLKQRARFDLFACSLSPFHKELLDNKFEVYSSWKMVGSRLAISPNSAQRIYKNICKKASKIHLLE